MQQDCKMVLRSFKFQALLNLPLSKKADVKNLNQNYALVIPSLSGIKSKLVTV
jgi:hypothetical protein